MGSIWHCPLQLCALYGVTMLRADGVSVAAVAVGGGGGGHFASLEIVHGVNGPPEAGAP